jgi:hypothetical protein
MRERLPTLTREHDLSIAASARDAIDSKQDFFVLTGSYSIEALTKGEEVSHNDIDANVFTNDIPRSMARAGLVLAGGALLNAMRVENVKPNRLEYAIETEKGTRDLEIQFIEYDNAVITNEEIRFRLNSKSGKEIIVPTVLATLDVNAAAEEEFRVKSLEFAVATWALRISGLALSQKRPVRQTDIDHFVFLAQASHSNEGVIESMRLHPQMPENESPRRVFEIALEKVDNL